MGNRVVVTGMGIISPLGFTLEDYFQSLIDGKSGIGLITRFDASSFPVRIAAELKGFNPEDYIDKKEARRMDRFTQYAMAGAKLAMEDSKIKIDDEDLDRIGVVIASGIGGITTFEEQHTRFIEKGADRISPFFIPMMISDIAAGMISIAYKARGPNYAVTSACASSAHAIGDAYEIIKRGDADVMITGGAEAAITPMGVGGFSSMKALSTRNDEPQKASRPFDAKRNGFVIGEGSGIIILESLEHAKKRGAHIYAEIGGWGITGDAFHITEPSPKGEGAAKAMQLAIKHSGLNPEDIDYINAHGTSTPYNDRTETLAIKTVFGEHAYKLAVNSTKSMIGHLLGASGAAEFIATVLSIEKSIVHPTINYEEKDPDCDLDYVPNKSRQMTIRNAISNSLGFGGHNVSLLIKKFVE